MENSPLHASRNHRFSLRTIDHKMRRLIRRRSEAVLELSLALPIGFAGRSTVQYSPLLENAPRLRATPHEVGGTLLKVIAYHLSRWSFSSSIVLPEITTTN